MEKKMPLNKRNNEKRDFCQTVFFSFIISGNWNHKYLELFDLYCRITQEKKQWLCDIHACLYVYVHEDRRWYDEVTTTKGE